MLLLWNSENLKDQKYFWNVIVLQGKNQSGVTKLSSKKQWLHMYTNFSLWSSGLLACPYLCCDWLPPETHKGLKCVTRCQCYWIFSFSKFYIWKPSLWSQKSNRFNNFARANHAFLYISLLSLHNYDMKVPFYGGRKDITVAFFLFSWTLFRRTVQDGISVISFEAGDFLSDQLCERSHYNAIPGSIFHFGPTFLIISGMKFSLKFIRLLWVVFSSQQRLNRAAVNAVQWRHSLPENWVVILIGWLSKHLHNYV